MDKLEQYLDQVCRSVGGPKALREHMRQELREHLLDAVAQHKSAGLSEEMALAKALEEFGKPEDVRSELQATHGQRMMMAVVIDKALEWKEKTMRAKWLWTSWANLALAVMIILEFLFITFNVVFIVPKYQKLMHDGMIEYAAIEEHGMSWMPAFLQFLRDVGGGYTTFILLGAAAVWGLFEWRVQSENKSLMRLSAFGTVAVGLLVVVVFMGAALAISCTLAMPALGQMAKPFAMEQIVAIDTAVRALEEANAKKELTQEERDAMQKQAAQASIAMNRLSAGPALASLRTGNERQSLDELRANLKEAQESLSAVQQAMNAEDARRVETELAKVRKALEPLRAAAKIPGR